MNNYKLQSELVPKTCWYSNVRSNVTREEWDFLRKSSYEAANNKCEICGETGKNQGYKHNVECHEIWEYNDETHIQKLIGLISLCPICHKVKHMGLASINGETELVISQLMKVNKIERDEVEEYIGGVFKLWGERSRHNWELDIKYIENILSEHKNSPPNIL